MDALEFISDIRRRYQVLRLADEHVEQEIYIILAGERIGVRRLQKLLQRRQKITDAIMVSLAEICRRARADGEDDPIVRRLRKKARSINLARERLPVEIELLADDDKREKMALLTAYNNNF